MKKLLQYNLFLAAIALTYSLFYPNYYDVSPFKERPNTQFWELNTGSRIGYTLIKSESTQKRSPIVYLHGGPGGMIKESIIETLKPLSKEHDLYFYDQVGSGHSNRLENIGEYSVKRHQKDLEEIITQIGAEKVILLGHSWGAMLAMAYLANHPNKVEKVILTGPCPILPIYSKLSHQKAPDSLNLIQPKFSNREANEKTYNRRSKLVHYWANVFEQKLASDQEMDDFFTLLNTQLSKSTLCDGSKMKAFEGGSGYYAHIMTVKSFGEVEDKREILKKLDLPILILKGQCDNQKWGFTQEYLNLFSNAQLKIIQNSGHSITKENQEIYIDLMLDFLKKRTFTTLFEKETKAQTHEEWIQKEYKKQMAFAIQSDSIDLFGISLPTLPEDFYAHPNVKYIRIDCHESNCLTSLSPHINTFKKLTKLTLSKTSLTELPKEIGDLSMLKHLLVLGGGQLKSVPEEIGQLTNLEILDLWRNKLNSLPNSIQNLTKLKVLYIGENNFSIAEIKKIKQLLPNCKVTLDR